MRLIAFKQFWQTRTRSSITRGEVLIGVCNLLVGLFFVICVVSEVATWKIEFTAMRQAESALEAGLAITAWGTSLGIFRKRPRTWTYQRLWTWLFAIAYIWSGILDNVTDFFTIDFSLYPSDFLFLIPITTISLCSSVYLRRNYTTSIPPM